MVRVSDVDAHRARAAAAGAAVEEAEDHFYGERQYTAIDLAGRMWVFSQSIADLDPSDWAHEPPDISQRAHRARKPPVTGAAGCDLAVPVNTAQGRLLGRFGWNAKPLAAGPGPGEPR